MPTEPTTLRAMIGDASLAECSVAAQSDTGIGSRAQEGGRMRRGAFNGALSR